MSKTYREWSPEQSWLFPPSPRDWLPEGDLVYFLLDVVGQMDLSAITDYYERSSKGQPPFHPQLLLYCYATGTASSRRIMQRCERDAACRVIVSQDVPNFRTISDFRKLHLSALEGLFVEVLKLCAQAGLVKVGTVALDGTKVKANASRHKAMSYERMQQEEPRLKEQIAELLRQAEAADAQEDAQHGDRRGDELPAELARRESRLKKIQEAKAALEAAAQAKADAEDARRQAAGEPPVARQKAVQPEAKAQRNFTDPESKIMRSSNKGWDQCGNAQALANAQQIILAADVTDQANDKRQVQPMFEQTRQNLDQAGVEESIEVVLADAGYYSAENTEYLEAAAADPHLATGRQQHGEEAPAAPRGRIPDDLTPQERMARKLRTKRGRELYAKRKGIIEPVFGQIKQGRGFRQFLLRGLAKMRGEWRLICLTHNLLKLHRHSLAAA